MATTIIANETTKSVKTLGQRLLVDTARMSVRRIGRNEQILLGALKSLGPVERATLVSFVGVLEAKKRKRVQSSSVVTESAEPNHASLENGHG